MHPAFYAINTSINNNKQENSYPPSEGFILKNANAIWLKKELEFEPDFIETIVQYYAAEATTLDFGNSPEASRNTINDWVAEQTENRILDLIPPGALTPATALVLTNAIYFKAEWLNQFNTSNTIDSPFYLKNGETISVPMMKQTDYFKYFDGNGYKALEMPYSQRNTSMIILLPDKNKYAAFEDTLNTQLITSVMANIHSEKIKLGMPKLEFSAELHLSKTLSEMGMPLAFQNGNADFSGITMDKGIYISEVIHKAFIKVDEKGTEAAAATEVTMVESAPKQPKIYDFIMDRPFIFLIRDNQTNSILFMGRVLNPLE